MFGPRTLIVICLTTVTLLFSASCSFAQERNLASALPSASDLPGFGSFQRKQAMQGKLANGFGRRKIDGLNLFVIIEVADSAQAAFALAKEAIDTPAGPMPEGSPTGRRLGQKVWHTRHTNGRPRGAFSMVVQDGRTVTIIRLMYPIKGREEGKPVEKEFSSSDLLLAENVALNSVRKLSQLGFAGHSTN